MHACNLTSAQYKQVWNTARIMPGFRKSGHICSKSSVEYPKAYAHCWEFTGSQRCEDQEVLQTVYVVEKLHKPLVSRPAIEALKLLVHVGTETLSPTQQFPQLFDDLGKMQDETPSNRRMMLHKLQEHVSSQSWKRTQDSGRSRYRPKVQTSWHCLEGTAFPYYGGPKGSNQKRIPKKRNLWLLPKMGSPPAPCRWSRDWPACTVR